MVVRPSFGRVDVESLLENFRGRSFNYEPQGSRDESDGWHRDTRSVELPPEPPGEPAADGSWETARHATADYAFSDPELVRGHFDAGEPLEGRTMVLELRVWTLRIYVGVRVTEVHDEIREIDGERVRVWGWTYGTLKGHVEQGERTFDVLKRLDSGRVEFVTHAFSRPAAMNPVVRLGYALLGRPRQRRFVQSSADRTAALVRAKVEEAPAPK